jgi:hypothetical protein
VSAHTCACRASCTGATSQNSSIDRTAAGDTPRASGGGRPGTVGPDANLGSPPARAPLRSRGPDLRDGLAALVPFAVREHGARGCRNPVCLLRGHRAGIFPVRALGRASATSPGGLRPARTRRGGGGAAGALDPARLRPDLRGALSAALRPRALRGGEVRAGAGGHAARLDSARWKPAHAGRGLRSPTWRTRP